MAKFTVGCVPFVNARPLVAWFESPDAPDGVELVYEIPSKLPAMLDSGDVDVVLGERSHHGAPLFPGRVTVASTPDDAPSALSITFVVAVPVPSIDMPGTSWDATQSPAAPIASRISKPNIARHPPSEVAV